MVSLFSDGTASFYIHGIPEMEANMRLFVKTIRGQVARALFIECQRILKIATGRVPVLTGALRDSGKVHEPEVTESEISCTISFGDETVKYAISVHERTHIRHISGQSKYLESVMLEEENNILQNIVNNLDI